MAINRIASSFVIHRLSHELLYLIFYFSIGIEHFHCRSCVTHCRLNIISVVCRTWSHGAVGYSILWSRLCACVTQDTRCLNWYLSRARPCPLDPAYSICRIHPRIPLPQVLGLIPRAHRLRLSFDDYRMDRLDFVHRYSFIIAYTSILAQIFAEPLPRLRHLEIFWVPIMYTEEIHLGSNYSICTCPVCTPLCLAAFWSPHRPLIRRFSRY